MKQSKLKNVLFAALFIFAACTAAVFAEHTPVEKINWHNADSTGGAPGDTTDGGIRHPGIGH